MPFTRSRVGLGGGYGGGLPPSYSSCLPPSLGRDQEEDISLLRSFFSTPDAPFGSFEARKSCVSGVHIVQHEPLLIDK
jgi:hypothetical protein